MEAENFSIEELTRLTLLARSKGIKVYLALNSLIKEGEIEKTWKILQKVSIFVNCHALIVQDPGIIHLARKAGFKGELHLSTLGNCTSMSGLIAAQKAGFNRVVLPREFTIDDIKNMAENTPGHLDLEVFIHGALCYAVSGRCYWSSWFGGKSGLRGRCVQPCRRVYTQKNQQKRFFSCMDFSVDTLTKVLKTIPQVSTWKIEGRKKSSHYVYYTVKGYRLLRDHPDRKKEALGYLEYALSRSFTHYRFLSQRIQNPLDNSAETGSGLFAGRVQNETAPFFITREALFLDDLIRIGYEDDDFHKVQRITRAVPKRGKFYLNKSSKGRIKKGTPVFIIDRKETLLKEAIASLERELESIGKISVTPGKASFRMNIPKKLLSKKAGRKIIDLQISSGKQKSSFKDSGIWLSSIPIRPLSSKALKFTWWWLPPFIFPEEEKAYQQNIDELLASGARKFILNAPWQISLFKSPEKYNLWAGPFCNISNTLTLTWLKDMGFSGAIVSPELDRDTFLSLPENSMLPLGVLIFGNWPIAVSKIVSQDLELNQLFFSPKGEGAWIEKFFGYYAVFPQWCLDLREKRKELQDAGYTMFTHMEQKLPKGIQLKNRPGLWNWNLKLL